VKRSRRDKVVPLHVVELGPCEAVIGFLEDMLARAKRGEVRGVAVAASIKGDCWGTAFEPGDGAVSHLLAGTAELQRRILEKERR
jgi:hypothetical protein